MRRFGTERYTSVAARCEVNSPRAAYLSRAARTRFAFAFADDVSRIDSTVKTRRHSLRRRSASASRTRHNCRVEVWRGGLGLASLCARPFVCGCLTILAMLRFHTPLIKPDRRFSRIRLSDKAYSFLLHTFAHEPLPLGSLELVESQLLVQVSSGYRVFP